MKTYQFTLSMNNSLGLQSRYEKKVIEQLKVIGLNTVAYSKAKTADDEQILKVIIDIKRNGLGHAVEMTLYMCNISIGNLRMLQIAHEYIGYLKQLTHNQLVTFRGSELPTENAISPLFDALDLEDGDSVDKYDRNRLGKITRQKTVCHFGYFNNHLHHATKTVPITINTTESKSHTIRLTRPEHQCVGRYFELRNSPTQLDNIVMVFLEFLDEANRKPACHRLYFAIQVLSVSLYNHIKQIAPNRSNTRDMRCAIADKSHELLSRYKRSLMQSFTPPHEQKLQKYINNLDRRAKEWHTEMQQNIPMPD